MKIPKQRGKRDHKTEEEREKKRLAVGVGYENGIEGRGWW